MVFAALCDKLVDIDAKLNIVPQLATSWSWTPDQKTLTMKLREGVKFQDGEPLDAEAVKFNLERHLKPRALSGAARSPPSIMWKWSIR